MKCRNIISLLLITLISVCTVAQESVGDIVILDDHTRIRLSPNGAIPIQWDVSRTGTGGETVHMMHDELADQDLGGHFRLVLDGIDGDLTHFANSARYSSEAATTDPLSRRFVSPMHVSGLQISKMVTTAEGYTGVLTVHLSNRGNANAISLSDVAITIGPGLGIIPGSIGGLGDAMYSYVEAAAGGDDGVKPFDLNEESWETDFPLDDSDVRWVGIHNRYYGMFLRDVNGGTLSGRAYVPVAMLEQAEVAEEDYEFYPAFLIQPTVPDSLGPGESVSFAFEFYAGPKEVEALEVAGYDAILYSNLPGWLRWLCLVLGDVLKAIYGVIGSWWVTLLVLTVLVRILLFPMAQKAIKMNAQMMADQAKLKPLIDEIKAKHSDAQVQYKKTMALYKEHGINPLAPMLGCLPVLLQLPILIAIFNILGQEIDMQGARFLWIDDLSIPDQLFPFGFTIPYFGAYFNILPMLMAVTMVLTTNLGTSAEGDQKKSHMRSMIMLAALFFTLFYSFPAGLVLYWMMSNIGQYIQQEIVTRRVNAKS